MSREEKIANELKKTKGYVNYNNWSNRRTDYGYHSYNIEEINIIGQRNPKKRLRIMKEHINFNDKVVVDFGCNVGAMLHHLPEIKQGVGFDYDINSINAANKISNILNRDNLNFHVFDFDKDDFGELVKKIPHKPDIVFVLSIGAWVKNILKIHELCEICGSVVILETNNDSIGKKELDFYRSRKFNINMISNNSDDDVMPQNKKNRKTYLIRNE